MNDIDIAPPREADKPGWRRLYDGYAAFYKAPMNDAVAETVWGWINDPAEALQALLAKTPEGRVVGLAHFREMHRPLSGTRAGFLDDLFVDPACRGRRVADRLIEAVAAHGRSRNWSLIRWLTAEDNYRARAVYDRTAKRTQWVTYQLDL
jgi:ribosomal protein S18 acetylase RimI-like enzyme